jgi:putative NIF3 family GTP cyclohydrolase 1 type 2
VRALAPHQIVMKRLLDLMHGARAEDWLPLMYPELMECRVYEFDMVARACYHPRCGEVPWPIVYVTSMFSRKHILTKRSIPCPAQVSKSATQFGNKTERRWANAPGVLPKFWLRGAKWRQDAQEVSSIKIPPETRAWVRMLRAKLTQAAQRAIDARGHAMAWCNTARVINFALRVLKTSQWAVMMTDKDGGWCLIKKV